MTSDEQLPEGIRNTIGDSAEEAAMAYDVAARKYHGEFARLNFSHDSPT